MRVTPFFRHSASRLALQRRTVCLAAEGVRVIFLWKQVKKFGKVYSATVHSGSFLLENPILKIVPKIRYFAPPYRRAPVEHTRIHLPQEMHASGSVA